MTHQGRNLKDNFTKGAILNINKPIGWSSFDVVKKIKYTFKIPKIGHAGTLDPFATGVLLILIGSYTKRAQYFTNLEKEYEGEIELGISTDTLDIDGKIVSKTEIKNINPQQVLEVCRSFIGGIMQAPPMYSAVKSHGQRLYRLARAGKTVEIKPKAVKIYKLDVIDIKLPRVKIKVLCSKGTYIRALARDIGEKLGCGAYLRSLIRTRIGDFRIEASLNIDDLTKLGVFTAE